MFGLFEAKIDNPVLNYKQRLHLDEDAIKYINWLADRLDLIVKDIDIKDEPINFQDGILTVAKLKYVLHNPHINKDHVYNTFLFRFIDNYIILNGLRYAFVFSQTDRPITRFGTTSTDIKLSNLYRKVVFKNALSSDTDNLKYESKFANMPLLSFYFILLNEINPNLDEKDIYEKHEYLYKKLNLEFKEVKNTNIKINKRQNKIFSHKVNDNTIYHVIYDKIYEIYVDDYTNPFIRKLITSYNPSAKIINMIQNKTMIYKKIVSEFKALFDPFTSELLKVKDYKDFTYNYLFNGYIIDEANTVGRYTDAATKQITIRQFILYPLIRQIAHMIFTYNLYGYEKLPLKHNITLSILYKSMQIELADGHLNNPAAEYAINTKITYMHRFAIKRSNSTTRLITNLQGIIDPISTPETKKTGANNYLVIQPILNII